MTHSTYIQKLVVGDIITGIEEKSIYKVITPRRIDVDQKTNKKPSQLVSSCEGRGSFKDYLIKPIILPWLSQAQPKDFCLLITLGMTSLS